MKNKGIQKTRRIFFFFLFFFCLLISVIVFTLYSYLFTIQRKERLSKVKDYSMFQVSYQVQNRCQTKKKFDDKNTSYYYDCLDNIYIHYGTTKITLEYAIKNEYISFNDLIRNTQEWEGSADGVVEYIHLSTKNSAGYKIQVLDNGHRNVTISKYY